VCTSVTDDIQTDGRATACEREFTFAKKAIAYTLVRPTVPTCIPFTMLCSAFSSVVFMLLRLIQLENSMEFNAIVSALGNLTSIIQSRRLSIFGHIARMDNNALCQDDSKTPFTRYNRLYNRFDNRLYRVNKHPTGCQTGCDNRFDNRVERTAGLTTGCIV